MVLIASVWLNSFLLNLGREKFFAFLAGIFALSQFGWTTGVLDGIGGGLSTLVTGVFIYSLGGFLRLFNPLKNVRPRSFVLAIIALYAFVFVSQYNLTYFSIRNFDSGNPNALFRSPVIGFGNNSFVVVAFAICLFEIFRKIHIPDSNAVNFFGSATFMVYLLHDNRFFRSLWAVNRWIEKLHDRPLRFLLDLSLCALATFFAGVLAYCAYRLLRRVSKLASPAFLNRPV